MEPAEPDHEVSPREQCKEAVQEMSDENDSEQTETLSNPSQKLWISSQESDEPCPSAAQLAENMPKSIFEILR